MCTHTKNETPKKGGFFNFSESYNRKKRPLSPPRIPRGGTQKPVLGPPPPFAGLTHMPLVAHLAVIYDRAFLLILMWQGGPIPVKRAKTTRTTDQKRLTRLQVMLSADEVAVLEDFRFEKRMPTLAAAIREILRRGLTVNGFALADKGLSSSEFGVLESGGRNRSAAAATQAGIDRKQKPRIGEPVEPARADRTKGN